MQQPILEFTSTTARWQHGMSMFLHELDALVVTGRINPDARNVICWALKQAITQVNCDLENSNADIDTSR